MLAHRILNLGFDVTRRGLELGLHAPQFVEFDFTRDFGLNVIDITLRAAEQRPRGAGDTRQPLRPEYDQCDDADQRHLG